MRVVAPGGRVRNVRPHHGAAREPEGERGRADARPRDARRERGRVVGEPEDHEREITGDDTDEVSADGIAGRGGGNEWRVEEQERGRTERREHERLAPRHQCSTNDSPGTASRCRVRAELRGEGLSPLPRPADGAEDGGHAVDRNGLDILEREECLRLLSASSVGRLAVTMGALPVILPVNFLLDGDRVLIRTTSGTKLDAATRNAVVAFEVDDVDPIAHSGWSVCVTGMARDVTDRGRPLLHQPIAARALGAERCEPRHRDFDRNRHRPAYSARPRARDSMPRTCEYASQIVRQGTRHSTTVPPPSPPSR